MNSANTDPESVKKFWEDHPLGSLENPVPIGSREFFEWHDRVRSRDEGDFTEHLYEFNEHAGEMVLDIGCGNGWLVKNFAKGGATIHGVDLTENAIALTKSRLDFHGLSATLRVANAEALPFANNVFDYVTSSGVLHHTPNTEIAIKEAVRVTQNGGRGMISLYYKHALMHPALWGITKALIRMLFGKVPGRSNFAQIENPEDLVRTYDGNDNPIGKAYTKEQVHQLFNDVDIDAVETHFFPSRFLMSCTPKRLRQVMDRYFGLMIYIQYTKK